MSLDALLKLLPNSPWVTLLLIFVILYIVVERVFNFTTSIADRRSDSQLLDQADKATSILDRLPEGHKSHSDLLTYVSSGPIAELSKRQGERSARSSESAKRKDRITNMAMAYFGASLIAIFIAEEAIPALTEVWNDDEASYGLRVWYITFVITILIAIYLAIVMAFYGAIMGLSKVGNKLEQYARTAKLKVVHRRKAKKDKKNSKD